MFSLGRMEMSILITSQVEEEVANLEETVIVVVTPGGGIEGKVMAEVVVEEVTLMQIRVLLSRTSLVTPIPLQPPSQTGKCKV